MVLAGDDLYHPAPISREIAIARTEGRVGRVVEDARRCSGGGRSAFATS